MLLGQHDTSNLVTSLRLGHIFSIDKNRHALLQTQKKGFKTAQSFNTYFSRRRETWPKITDHIHNCQVASIRHTLDGSTYPKWKIDHFSQLNFFILKIKSQQAESGTSATTYRRWNPTEHRKARSSSHSQAPTGALQLQIKGKISNGINLILLTSLFPFPSGDESWVGRSTGTPGRSGKSGISLFGCRGALLVIGFGLGAAVDLFVINDNLVNNFFLLFIPKQMALLGFFNHQ